MEGGDGASGILTHPPFIPQLLTVFPPHQPRASPCSVFLGQCTSLEGSQSRRALSKGSSSLRSQSRCCWGGAGGHESCPAETSLLPLHWTPCKHGPPRPLLLWGGKHSFRCPCWECCLAGTQRWFSSSRQTNPCPNQEPG